MEGKTTLCDSCLLRYNCDDMTMFVCKTSNFKNYIADDSKSAYWKTFYECSSCGEISRQKRGKCPFCGKIMRN